MSDLRHVTPIEVGHVGGRSARSDLQEKDHCHVGGRSARSDLQEKDHYHVGGRSRSLRPTILIVEVFIRRFLKQEILV